MTGAVICGGIGVGLGVYGYLGHKKWAFVAGALVSAVGFYAQWVEARKLTADKTGAVGDEGARIKGSDPGGFYDPGSVANEKLTAAQDAWYTAHPDQPFVNDDGSYNILPGYEL